MLFDIYFIFLSHKMQMRKQSDLCKALSGNNQGGGGGGGGSGAPVEYGQAVSTHVWPCLAEALERCRGRGGREGELLRQFLLLLQRKLN